jgi:hypothetical protein
MQTGRRQQAAERVIVFGELPALSLPLLPAKME